MAAGADALFPVTQAIAPEAIIEQSITASDAYQAATMRNRAIMTDFVQILYDQRQPRVAFEKENNSRTSLHCGAYPSAQCSAIGRRRGCLCTRH